MPERKTPIAWFQTKYLPRADGCWIWMRSVRDGYGCTEVRGKNVRAHRRSWELHRGPIPPGLFVLHRCDVPLCVNPDHLFLGTHADNMADMVRKARTTRKRGPKKPAAARRTKLTWGEVEEIRRSHAAGRGIKSLARMTGISPTQIRRIVRGERWKRPLAAPSESVTVDLEDVP